MLRARGRAYDLAGGKAGIGMAKDAFDIYHDEMKGAHLGEDRVCVQGRRFGDSAMLRSNAFCCRIRQ